MLKRTPILPKEKSCKSTKTKGFGCGKPTLIRKLGLCVSCYPKWLLNSHEGQEAIKRQTIPLQKKEEDFKAAKRDFEERKSIPYLLTSAINACHAYIRERDVNKPCVSCGTQWMPNFQACHFLPAGKFPRLKFDENNIHGGCQKCNLYDNGNESGYRQGLTERMGAEYVAEIDEKARLDKLQGVHKWQREDLIKIRKYYTAKLSLIKPKK